VIAQRDALLAVTATRHAGRRTLVLGSIPIPSGSLSPSLPVYTVSSADTMWPFDWALGLWTWFSGTLRSTPAPEHLAEVCQISSGGHATALILLGQGETLTSVTEPDRDADLVKNGLQVSVGASKGDGVVPTGESTDATAATDTDTPTQLMVDGKNLWPPNVSLSALEDAVNRLLGEECKELIPWDCGLYHVIVKIILRSGKTIVARITGGVDAACAVTLPFLPDFKEGSEVATMRYIREYTTIPVPEIYAADEDLDGIVGGAFTLQEFIPGKNLDDLWQSLSLAAQSHVMEQIADFALQLFHLSFDTIGSLQHTYDHTHCRWNYSVGPMVTMQALPNWDIVGPPPHPGPWMNARDWLTSRARGYMRYRCNHPDEADEQFVERVIALVRESESDNGLPDGGDLATCGLYHPDFGLHQFIARQSEDPSKVDLVALLDWEAAQVIPRWALGQALRIKPRELNQDLVEHCRALMRTDELYKKAQVEGLQARALSDTVDSARVPDPSSAWIESFRAGYWDDGGRIGA